MIFPHEPNYFCAARIFPHKTDPNAGSLLLLVLSRPPVILHGVWGGLYSVNNITTSYTWITTKLIEVEGVPYGLLVSVQSVYKYLSTKGKSERGQRTHGFRGYAHT